MKLKTLLLGSAAAMMAATSSFAADAVVAEPEAVEYVRVCDAYGAGWFFIPGTERCLKLSGEFRTEYRIVNSDAGTGDDIDAEWAYRARFAVESANESDFGTIKTYMRFEANYGDPVGSGDSTTSGRDVGLQALTLSIGGYETGVFDNYWTKNNGYGNLFAMDDGDYGYGQSIYSQYTYEIAGFAVTAGLEQFVNNPAGVNDPELDDLSYYLGASYGASFGDFAATVYYDGILNEVDYKLSALIKPIEGLQLKAWYLGGDGTYTLQTGANDYVYGLSGAYTFGDFTPYLGWHDGDGAVAGTIVGGVVWAPSSANGLKVQGEINYVTEDFGTGANPQAYRVRLIKTF